MGATDPEYFCSLYDQAVSGVSAGSVCGVIISYNPPEDILGNIEALRSQVKCLVVVDNGSAPQKLTMLRNAQREYCFELVEKGQNLGIAAALNVGVQEGSKRGCDWVACFDHDSTVGPGYIDCMLQAFAHDPGSTKVGLVCPVWIDKDSGITMPVSRSKDGLILSAMTSGSLIPLGTFESVGTFNELLFMDYVDIEFCLRARRAGYRIIQSPHAVLYHSLGNTTRHRLLWHSFSTTNHSPERRYYITRNRVWSVVRFLGDWRWSASEAKVMGLETLKIMLVEHDRLKKFRNMLLGISDAVFGRMGKRFDL